MLTLVVGGGTLRKIVFESTKGVLFLRRPQEVWRFGSFLRATRYGFKLFEGSDVLFRLVSGAQEEGSIVVEVCSLDAFQGAPAERLGSDFFSWETKDDQMVREKVKSGLLECRDLVLSSRLKFSRLEIPFSLKDEVIS